MMRQCSVLFVTILFKNWNPDLMYVMLVTAAVELVIKQGWRNAVFKGGAKEMIDSLKGIIKHGQHIWVVEDVLESVSSIDYASFMVELMKLAQASELVKHRILRWDVDEGILLGFPNLLYWSLPIQYITVNKPKLPKNKIKSCSSVHLTGLRLFCFQHNQFVLN